MFDLRKNTAPVPELGVEGAQAIALRIEGDQAINYGANHKDRVSYSKQLTDSQASHFISISYIDGDQWLH